jgi:hypothetical protein
VKINLGGDLCFCNMQVVIHKVSSVVDVYHFVVLDSRSGSFGQCDVSSGLICHCCEQFVQCLCYQS